MVPRPAASTGCVDLGGGGVSWKKVGVTFSRNRADANGTPNLCANPAYLAKGQLFMFFFECLFGHYDL